MSGITILNNANRDNVVQENGCGQVCMRVCACVFVRLLNVVAHLCFLHGCGLDLFVLIMNE